MAGKLYNRLAVLFGEPLARTSFSLALAVTGKEFFGVRKFPADFLSQVFLNHPQ
jgi:hypothetical protein